jgi:hypothetical protein
MHKYITRTHTGSSLPLPSPHPIVASGSLRLLYLLIYSEHNNHIQVLGFPLVCNPCPIILLHFFGVYNPPKRENMRFLTFWAWLTLLKMIFSSSIHLLVNDNILFFFVAEQNSILYKYHIFLIHLSVVGHLGYFKSLAIVNSAAINMGVQVPL